MSITDGFPVLDVFTEWANEAPIKTLPQMLDNSVTKWGDRPYLSSIQGKQYQFKTYSEIYYDINCLASAFLEMGIRVEDRIANFSTNRPEWPVVDFATACIGCVHVPMYPTLSQAEMAYIVNDAQARAVVASSSEHLHKVLAVINEGGFPKLEHVIAMDGCEVPEQRFLQGRIRLWNWQELMETGRGALNRNRPRIDELKAAVQSDWICSLVYTSGTTGHPKGAMLMHGNFCSQAYGLAPIIAASCEDVELSFLPLSHVFERVVYYALTSCGASIGYVRSVRSVPQDMQTLHPTIVPSVPRLFELVFARVIEKTGEGFKRQIFDRALKVGRAYRKAKKAGKISAFLKAEYAVANRTIFKKIRDVTGGKVRFFVSGGAPLRPSVIEFFLDTGFTILEGYGLTETSPVLCLNMPNNINPGTVGEAVPSVAVKIADDGEIVAKGPNIMRGYFNNLQATQETIDQDGWLHTCDVGEMDENGVVTITDRKKEILVLSNGKNVAPQPLELALNASEWIEQSVIVGNNRGSVGALLVPNFTKLEAWAVEEKLPTDRQVLVAHERVKALMQQEVHNCLSSFSNYEKVKRLAILSRELSAAAGELTPTLKIKRRIVDANFRDLIEELYAGDK